MSMTSRKLYQSRYDKAASYIITSKFLLFFYVGLYIAHIFGLYIAFKE